jgi:murein DD-endopeptidase MepM/ murein hydrolase activator NlpD
MLRTGLFTALLLILLTACQSDAPEAISVTLEDEVRVALRPSATSVPSATASPETRTPLSPSATPSPTATASPAPPTATPAPGREPRFHLRRPIASSGANFIDRTYPYGDTQQGVRPLHHGVEFVNPIGTAVLAAADGTVVYGGPDSETVFGPHAGYYGSVIVIEHPYTAPNGEPIYTLYGHLERVNVEAGDTVEVGFPIGTVGMSGVAVGPHLHFEVRVGDPYSFDATRNPEFWLIPFPRTGVLAGAVVDEAGSPIHGAEVQIHSASSDRVRYTFTYGGDSVNGDALWQENFTYGDLPVGDYTVYINVNGVNLFSERVTVTDQAITWIDAELQL